MQATQPKDAMTINTAILLVPADLLEVLPTAFFSTTNDDGSRRHILTLLKS